MMPEMKTIVVSILWWRSLRSIGVLPKIKAEQVINRDWIKGIGVIWVNGVFVASSQ